MRGVKKGVAALAAALAITVPFEGKRNEAYQDQAGVWTVCYGHTAGVRRGMAKSDGECEDLLAEDVKEAQQAVRRNVRHTIKQGEEAALIDFVFHFGETKFRNSTLLKKFNEYSGDRCYEILRWVYVKDANKNKYVKSRGLEKRAMEEFNECVK